MSANEGEKAKSFFHLVNKEKGKVDFLKFLNN